MKLILNGIRRYNGIKIAQKSLVWLFQHSLNLVQRSEEHTSELQSRENLVCHRYLHSFPSRRSSDLAVPSSSGFTQETTNLGDLKNSGVELALKAFVVDEANFKWNSAVQWYQNRSKITRLAVPAFPQPGA